MFSVCEVIQLFSVVFYVVTAVYKFDFRLVINGEPNKWRPVAARSSSDRDSCFLAGSVCVSAILVEC
jgi:hypothetical protein